MRIPPFLTRRGACTVAAGILGALAGSLILGVMNHAGVPECSLSTHDLDLGLAEPGVPLTGAVRISNAGTGVLEIARVKPACGCTGVELDSKALGPGLSATLRVRLVPDRSPRTRTSVAIETNDPNRPVQMLTLRTERQNPTEISAEQIVLHLGASEKSASRRLRLTEHRGRTRPIGAVFAESSSETLKVCLSSSRFGKDGAIDVDIVAADDGCCGITQHTIRIYDSTHRVEHNVGVEVRRDSEWLQLKRQVICFSDVPRRTIELSLLPQHSTGQIHILSAAFSEHSPLRVEVGSGDSASLDLLPSPTTVRFWRGHVEMKVAILLDGVEQVETFCIPTIFISRQSGKSV